MRVDISFITVNYNGLSDTLEFVASIHEKVRSVTYEIIVVDNHSTSNEAEAIAAAHPEVRVISSSRNLGFAGGNNLALPHAQGRYLFFINNDTVIHTDGFGALVRRFESDPSLGMLSPKIRFWAEPTILQYAGFTPLSPITLRNKGVGCGEEDKGQYDAARETAFAHGAAMMIPAAVLQEVGAMREDYFLYYEELDWAETIRRHGYRIYYDPSCVILHKESRATGENSPLKAYYLTRNRLLFAHRNRPAWLLPLCYLYLTLAALLHSLRGTAQHRSMTRRGIADFYHSRYGQL
ncbi:MAG: glycosyltransferase family 2 protein [Bacteroidaceae bacterium]|nr:glycosyltransferase family 2 protein [Bacteroidaceae bacterium]